MEHHESTTKIRSLKLVRSVNFLKENDFIDAFYNFIRFSEDPENILNSLKPLKNSNFKNVLQKVSALPFEKGLLEGNDLSRFQKLMTNGWALISESDYGYVTEKLNELVSNYSNELIPRIEIGENEKRNVLEIRGTHIVLSRVIHDLQANLMKNLRINKIVFVCTDILHINSNLDNTIFHGKTFEVVTKFLKVTGQVKWDLSGKSNIMKHAAKAAGIRIHGKDGEPGENGGNVSMNIEEIENQESFLIISNGGNGSNGQDGGEGVKGEDSRGISLSSFQDRFPPCSPINMQKRLRQIKETRAKLKRIAENTITNWKNGDWESYIHIFTFQGHEIIFSSSENESLLLHKGGKGKIGPRGGHGGKGGKGGTAGKITINKSDGSEIDIKTQLNNGEDGADGSFGKNGERGAQGWDIGWMDSTNKDTKKWPIFFGGDCKSIVHIEYSIIQQDIDILIPYKNINGFLPYARLEKISKNDNKISEFFKSELTDSAIFEDVDKPGEPSVNEIDFLKAFDNLLKFFNNPLALIDAFKLKEFKEGKLKFHELLRTMCDVFDQTDSINGLQNPAIFKKLEILIQFCSQILISEYFFRIINFHQLIDKYLDEKYMTTAISVQEKGDRKIIEVTGTRIIFSQVLEDIRNFLIENPKIEEIRFISSDIVHVDETLDNKIWHGMNIVLISNDINIIGYQKWDVSGKSSDFEYIDNNGKDAAGTGLDGKDGYTGESGGNILISCEYFENLESLMIISCGGNGSKGQNGGSGSDGENGKGLSKEELDERFPTCCFYAKIIDNRKLETISHSIESTQARIIKNWVSADNMNMFYHVFTNNGSEIIFSYSDNIHARRAFLLYKGSPGLKGQLGGRGGLCGEGGNPGDINVYRISDGSKINIDVRMIRGTDGSESENGLNGYNGISGWDIGWLDFSNLYGSSGWPKHFGENLDSKLNLYYTDTYHGEEVYCYFKKKFVRFENQNVNQIKLRNNKVLSRKQKNERQSHAKATMKKTISFKAMMNEYSEQLTTSLNLDFLSLEQDLFAEKEKIKNINYEKSKQKHQMNQKIKEDSKIVFEHNKKKEKKNLSSADDLYANKPENGEINFMSDLKASPSEPINWYNIKTFHLTKTNFREVYRKFITLDSINGNDKQTISAFLIDKYRFLIYQEVENKIRSYIEKFRPTMLFKQCNPQLQHNCEHNHLNIQMYPLTSKRLANASHNNKLDDVIQIMLNDNLTSRSFIINEYVKRKDEKKKRYLKECKKTQKDFIASPNSSSEDFKLFRSYLERWGMKSATYRKLLCLIYDVNIIVFEKKNYNERLEKISSKKTPLSNEKPSMHDVYIRFNKEKVEILEVDEEYFYLEKHRKRKDDFYKFLFSDLNNLETKEKLDSYNKSFNIEAIFDKFDAKTIQLQTSNEDEDIKQILEFFARSERYLIKKSLKSIKSEFSNQMKFLQCVKQRLVLEGLHITAEEFCYIINFIIDHCIEERPENFTFAWICVSNCQQNWIDEVLILQLENYFKKQIEKKGVWRSYLSRIKDKRNIIFLGLEMQKVKNISSEAIDEVLEILSELEDKNINHLLLNVELNECKYVLKEQYLTSKLVKILPDWKNSMLFPVASYYLVNVDNILTPESLKLFFNLLKSKNSELTPEILTEQILGSLHHGKWSIGDNDLKELENSKISSWITKMNIRNVSGDDERNLGEILKLIQKNSNTSKSVIDLLQKIQKIIEEIQSRTIKIDGKLISTFMENDIKNWVLQNKLLWQNKKKSYKNDSELTELLVIVYRAVELDKKMGYPGFSLRATQLLTVLSFLMHSNYENEEKFDILAQVSTGEGKSIVVAVTSIIKGFCGESVDIVTISSLLAERDADEFKQIYNLFDLNVSCNCNENTEDRIIAYQSNIVYGDLSSFQRDLLLHTFYGKNILGDRSFKNIIIDEVDSMLLDKGSNMLYLSHEMAILEGLESLFVYIWQWLNTPVEVQDAENLFKIENIRDAIYFDLFGKITIDYIASLDSKLSSYELKAHWYDMIDSKLIDKNGNVLVKKFDNSIANILVQSAPRNPGRLRYVLEKLRDKNKPLTIGDIEKTYSEKTKQDVNSIWDTLVKLSILNDRGHVLIKNHNDLPIDFLPSGSKEKKRLEYLLKKVVNRKRSINVPNTLNNFIESHLETWIKSAISAYFMEIGRDYVVDVDRTGTSSEQDPNIIIIDRDTGTDQTNSQWDEAMHQFLQLKHNCKLSALSLKAVFISNVSYFKSYEKLYGLTGTLGSAMERNSLQDVHKVDFVTIPTFKPKKFTELEPIYTENEETWRNRIITEVKKMVENQRSVLIICETIRDVEKLYGQFQTEYTDVYKYTRDYEKIDCLDEHNKLIPGKIIIATNLAGRGTDIKIADSLTVKGGLHVCLTYLPSNVRIEEQAFGRTSRKGESGSGQMIILITESHKKNHLNHFNLKKERDITEIERISKLNTHYKKKILIEENFFKGFKQQYEILKQKLSDKFVAKEVEDILLQSCLERWSFWLDKNIKENSKDLQEQSLLESFLEFLNQMKNLESCCETCNDWKEFVDGDIIQMVKLAKYLSLNILKLTCANETAMNLFDDVINREPYFSASAHYYKAFLLTRSNKFRKGFTSEFTQIFRKELIAAADLFNVHSNFAMMSAAVVGKIKKSTGRQMDRTKNTSKPVLSYEKQKQNIVELYNVFLNSIDDILGHEITPSSLESVVDGDEFLASHLFDELLKCEIITRLTVSNTFSDTIFIQDLNNEYAIRNEELTSFLKNKPNQKIYNIDIFIGNMEKKISLPSRRKFWNLLIDQHVLVDETIYVKIVNDNLNSIAPDLKKSVDELLIDIKLNQKNVSTDKDGELFFSQTNFADKLSVFEKSEFIKTIGDINYKTLEKLNVLKFNKKAKLNRNHNREEVEFSQFDSICKKDLVYFGVFEDECDFILKELEEKNILKRKTNSDKYILRDYEKGQNLNLSFEFYESVIKRAIAVCFAYRFAYRDLIKSESLKLNLVSNPHETLFFNLIDKKIIIPVKTSHDYDSTKSFENFSSEKFKKYNNKIFLNSLNDILQQSMSVLKKYDHPEANLALLSEIYKKKFNYVNEVNIFNLNGLDSIIKFSSERYSFSFWLSTIAVTAIGIIQVIIGVMIILKSFGSLSPIGAAFVFEGINDLFYATEAFTTGQFSWKHYGAEKLKAYTAFFSSVPVDTTRFTDRLERLEQMGCKVIAPIVKTERRIVDRYSEEYIFEVEQKKYTNVEIKKFLEMSMSDIKSGIFGGNVKNSLETRFKVICERACAQFENDFIVSFKKWIEKSKIFKEMCYNEKDLTINHVKKILERKSLTESYITVAENLSLDFAEKVKLSLNHANFNSYTQSTAVEIENLLESINHTGLLNSIEIDRHNNIMLNKLEKQMKNTVDFLKSYEQTQGTHEQPDNEKFEIHFTEIQETIFSEITYSFKEIITPYFLINFLNKHILTLVSLINHETIIKLSSIHEQMKTNDSEKIKKDLYKSTQALDDIDKSYFGIKQKISENYNEKLLKVFYKTKKPEIFAQIIENRVPMDSMCLQAVSEIINKIYNTNITIFLKGQQEVNQIKSLRIQDNLVEIYIKYNKSDFNRNHNTAEHYLLGAIKEKLPDIEDNSEKFIENITQLIRKNSVIQQKLCEKFSRKPDDFTC